VGEEEEDDGPWPGEQWFHVRRQDVEVPDVDWQEDEPIGVLELPDGTEVYVYDVKPSFGFARFLDDL